MAFRLLSVAQEVRSILADYPASLASVLGEALQNSADSGASTLTVELVSLPADAGGRSAGSTGRPPAPTLVIRNNALFRQRDALSWVSLRDSGKKTRPADVGSKGCGAKSFFHFGDVVVVRSGGVWLFSDPCSSVVSEGLAVFCPTGTAEVDDFQQLKPEDESNGGDGGTSPSIEEQKRAFLQAVSHLGAEPRRIFDSVPDTETVFLIPLRTAKSALSDNCFEDNTAVEGLEDDLKQYPEQLMADAVNLSQALTMVQVSAGPGDRPAVWKRRLRSTVVVEEEDGSSGGTGLPGSGERSPSAKRRRLLPPSGGRRGGTSFGPRGNIGGKAGSYPAIFASLQKFDSYEALYREVDRGLPTPRSGSPNRSPHSSVPVAPVQGLAPTQNTSLKRKAMQGENLRGGAGTQRAWLAPPPTSGSLVEFTLEEVQMIPSGTAQPQRTETSLIHNEGVEGVKVLAKSSYRVFCDFWDADPALLDVGQQINQVPIAGVAFPMGGPAPENHKSPALRLSHPCYCFLPLRNEQVTGLPVLLNAAFAVTEDRQRLVSIEGGFGEHGAAPSAHKFQRRFGEQQFKAQWNRMLLEGPLSQAYAKGLAALAKLVKTSTDVDPAVAGKTEKIVSAEFFYELFPRISADTEEVESQDLGRRITKRVRGLVLAEQVVLVPRLSSTRGTTPRSSKPASVKRVAEVSLLRREIFGEERFKDVELVLPYVQLEDSFRQELSPGDVPLVAVPLHVERFFGKNAWTYIELKVFAEKYFLPARERFIGAARMLRSSGAPAPAWGNFYTSTSSLETKNVFAAMERIFAFLVDGAASHGTEFGEKTPLRVSGGEEYMCATAYLRPSVGLKNILLPEGREALPETDGKLQNVLDIFKNSFRERLSDSELDAAIRHRLERHLPTQNASEEDPSVNEDVLNTLCEQCFPLPRTSPSSPSSAKAAPGTTTLRAAFLVRIFKSDAYQSSPDLAARVFRKLLDRDAGVLGEDRAAAHRLLRTVPCVPVLEKSEGEGRSTSKFALVPPSECSLHPLNFSPLLHRIPDELRGFRGPLANVFGITDSLTPQFLQTLLKKLEKKIDRVLEPVVVCVLKEWGTLMCKKRTGAGSSSALRAAPAAASSVSNAAPAQKRDDDESLVLCADLFLRPVAAAFLPDGFSSSKSTTFSDASTGSKHPLHSEFSAEDANRFGCLCLSELLDSMMKDGAAAEEQVFGQRVELVDIIRRTIDDYNDNHTAKLGLPTILRESLANFDDNRASEVHLIFDTRCFSGGGRLDGGVAAAVGGKTPHLPSAASSDNSLFSGPGIIIAGDSAFQQHQFEGIQSFARSSKQNKFDSDGRFGVGIATYFAVTDQLELLSNEKFCALDPCRIGVVKRRGGSGAPGCCYSESAVRQHWPAQLAPFEALSHDVPRGTVFRLPLRKTASVLKSNVRGGRVEVSALEKELYQLGAEPWAHLFDRYVRRWVFISTIHVLHTTHYSHTHRIRTDKSL